MKSNKFLFISLIVFSTLSYSCKTWTITQATSSKIAIDSTTDAIVDKNYEAYLQPMKQKIDAQMNVVIGQTAETMKGHGPESLLSNLSADVYLQAASDFLGSKVDISIVNLGGLRTVVPAGNITIRKVFELMPFENELVIVWIKGDKLNDLLQYFASMGGEGVSGLRMEIKQKKAVNITINGQALDDAKVYSIATNDYLAGGNDQMIQLAQYEKRLNTNIKIRDMLLNYIQNETKKGNKIQSKLDGRIKITNP
ncbi:5'-Nucleotidase domain-containing protein [Paludibacter propionicigenes WB4]|uniref:5'-Nucleotidase domain-containing protein n=1 Tax=Paludibacter propionicigenes (strain DSM 17365 / JCM 13257 / WB4) TaxID=694427 RepID=E4T5I4_PALPW|nr:5'-nucleotidase [Paludibacter propionicigenes]ADQ79978.1 5'-Nucleotidase domain-containing protein [Paludibacter propionicigenes WB4]